MTTMHTKGPWRAEGPDWFGDYNIMHPADSLAIGAAVTNLRQAAEVRANALLLAAAPDMLEVLRAIIERSGGRLYDTDQVTGETFDALARAAIAKAEGAS